MLSDLIETGSSDRSSLCLVTALQLFPLTKQPLPKMVAACRPGWRQCRCRRPPLAPGPTRSAPLRRESAALPNGNGLSLKVRRHACRYSLAHDPHSLRRTAVSSGRPVPGRDPVALAAALPAPACQARRDRPADEGGWTVDETGWLDRLDDIDIPWSARQRLQRRAACLAARSEAISGLQHLARKDRERLEVFREGAKADPDPQQAPCR